MGLPDQVLGGFGAGAGAYQRGRPGYPLGVLEYLNRHLALGPGRRVLDVGAGTGKFSELLARSGADVFALELVREMLVELAVHLPSVSAVNGDAHHLPIASASLDMVSAATAFHWFADEEAIDELARVLRPGGLLVTVSNRRDLEDPLGAQFEAILAAHRPPPTARDLQQASILSSAPQFEALGTTAIAHVHTMDLPQLLDLALSMSYLAARDSALQEEVAARVRRLVPPGGLAPVPYRAVVAAFRHGSTRP